MGGELGKQHESKMGVDEIGHLYSERGDWMGTGPVPVPMPLCLVLWWRATMVARPLCRAAVEQVEGGEAEGDDEEQEEQDPCVPALGSGQAPFGGAHFSHQPHVDNQN